MRDCLYLSLSVDRPKMGMKSILVLITWVIFCWQIFCFHGWKTLLQAGKLSFNISEFKFVLPSIFLAPAIWLALTHGMCQLMGTLSELSLTHLLKRVQQNVFQFSLCCNILDPLPTSCLIGHVQTLHIWVDLYISDHVLFVTMPIVIIINRFIIYVWYVPISALVLCKIGGSHGSGAEDSGLLGCGTVSLEGCVLSLSSRVMHSKKNILLDYCP